MAIPKPKKLSRTSLKAKCDKLASLYYREKTPYCEAAGLDDIQCGGGLQWCHIFGRAILHMRYEPFNNLIMCAGHHRWYGLHPIEWTRMLEQHYPERLALAEFNRYKYGGKLDYEDFIERFSTKS